MYIVSHMLKPVSHQELQQVEQEHAVRLPLAYQRWLQQYGEGTYSGWMNIQRPDPEVLNHLQNMIFGSIRKQRSSASPNCKSALALEVQ